MKQTRYKEAGLNCNAERWVAAMESGCFPRTVNTLRDASGFCPLGVGCDLYRSATGQGRWEKVRGGMNGVFTFILPAGEPAYGVLPTPVREWLGLRSAVGAWGKGDMVPYGSSLTVVNDLGDGDSWAKVIEIIKSEPTGLFI